VDSVVQAKIYASIWRSQYHFTAKKKRPVSSSMGSSSRSWNPAGSSREMHPKMIGKFVVSQTKKIKGYLPA